MNEFDHVAFSKEEKSIHNFFGDEAPDKMLFLGALDCYERLEDHTRDLIHTKVDGALNTARLDRLLELYAGSVGYIVRLKMEAEPRA